ncbi:MAG: hypothetical protein V3S22_04630 [Candidatus Neomarinimicrobiota bacterium]
MRQYLLGLITGAILVFTAVFFMGAGQIEDDSLQVIMSQLETYLKNEMEKEHNTGRFQLQSFQIERTHWHYMLDTATGKLYRLDPSRTAGNAAWILMAEANFKQ